MPTGRTGTEHYNDDCKLSCNYHDHPLSRSLHKALAESRKNEAYRIRFMVGQRMHQNTHFGTPKLKDFCPLTRLLWGVGHLSPYLTPIRRYGASIRAPSALYLPPLNRNPGSAPDIYPLNNDVLSEIFLP